VSSSRLITDPSYSQKEQRHATLSRQKSDIWSEGKFLEDVKKKAEAGHEDVVENLRAVVAAAEK